jgi:aryl-alcohol dehydrogenase-like predicted oxidoreductase
LLSNEASYTIGTFLGVGPTLTNGKRESEDMKYRQLGASDLHVSEISIGSWLTYGVGVERDRARACVHRALELGINLIDTANVYGKGAAEEFLGEVLADVPRKNYILATKLFGPMSDTDKGLSRAQIVKQLDASLRRLRTDYIDLYQCHRYDKDTPLLETMEALTEVVKQGKVRYIGFSEWPPQYIAEALAMPNVARFVSSQPEYSMLWRRPEQKVIPLCRDNGISQIVWSPLAQGVLTGKYAPGAAPPPDTRAASESMGGFIGNWMKAEVLEVVQQLKPLARQAGVTMSQFALAWILREPNVASAIVGASKPEQVEENAAASGLRIDPQLFAQADDVLRPVLRYS